MHAVPQSEGMAQQTQQCPSDAGWFLMFRAWSGLAFLMLCNFEDGVFEVMHELHSFPASSWFAFVFFYHLLFSFEFFLLFFFLRSTSYVFEVKECFKGTHCARGLSTYACFNYT